MHGFSHQPSDMLKSELWKSFKLHMILTSDLAPSKRPPKPTELKPISGHQTCHCYLLSLLLLMEEIRRSPVEFGSLSVIPLFTRYFVGFLPSTEPFLSFFWPCKHKSYQSWLLKLIFGCKSVACFQLNTRVLLFSSEKKAALYFQSLPLHDLSITGRGL